LLTLCYTYVLTCDSYNLTFIKRIQFISKCAVIFYTMFNVLVIFNIIR
jgi:hypothetical protein